jgi:hypothetical protein
MDILFFSIFTLVAWYLYTGSTFCIPNILRFGLEYLYWLDKITKCKVNNVFSSLKPFARFPLV